VPVEDLAILRSLSLCASLRFYPSIFLFCFFLSFWFVFAPVLTLVFLLVSPQLETQVSFLLTVSLRSSFACGLDAGGGGRNDLLAAIRNRGNMSKLRKVSHFTPYSKIQFARSVIRHSPLELSA